MPALTLKSLISPRSDCLPALTALIHSVGGGISIVDPAGKALLGEMPSEISAGQSRVPVQFEDATLGFVVGPSEPAAAIALLLQHFASRQCEARSLAAEVLHLYREVHLIEQLSEQLAALLNSEAVGQSALAQAQRLIPATHGSVLLISKEGGMLQRAAFFGDSCGDSANYSGPSGSGVAFCCFDAGARDWRNRE